MCQYRYILSTFWKSQNTHLRKMRLTHLDFLRQSQLYWQFPSFFVLKRQSQRSFIYFVPYEQCDSPIKLNLKKVSILQVSLCSTGELFVTFVPKGWSHILASNCNSSISTLWNSINSVQKVVDLTTPAKNRRKTRIIFRSKNWYLWPVELFEIGLPNPLYTAWFFVKCKCSNSCSVQMDKEIYIISSHWCERQKPFVLLHCVISISTLFSENSFKQQNKSSCPSARLDLNYANLL